MLRREPDVLAATLNDSGAEPNGALLVNSALVTLALFFCGPSSPSVASSAADVLPASRGFLRGRPRGLPVGALVRDALLEGLEVERADWVMGISTDWLGAGDEAPSPVGAGRGGTGWTGGMLLTTGPVCCG